MSTAVPLNIPNAPTDDNKQVKYSTTPHGTIYGSTPGGTRIIYDPSMMLSLASSQLSKTPPANMARIAGVTMVAKQKLPSPTSLNNHSNQYTNSNSPTKPMRNKPKPEKKGKDTEKKLGVKSSNPFAALLEDDVFHMDGA